MTYINYRSAIVRRERKASADKNVLVYIYKKMGTYASVNTC